jgi:hypothetical protein
MPVLRTSFCAVGYTFGQPECAFANTQMPVFSRKRAETRKDITCGTIALALSSQV